MVFRTGKAVLLAAAIGIGAAGCSQSTGPNEVGGTMVEATDRLEALLVMEECYEALLDLEGKDPVKEAEGLIQRKIKILKELLPAS